MTMPHHALEIALTRPLAPAELRHAARVMPLAANYDTTRLMALPRAKTPGRAVRCLRQLLDTQLPIDVITTHYPDASGQVLLNVAFPPAARTTLKTAADRAGHSPERFVQLALHRALAQHASDEADRLDQEVRRLLAHTTAAHFLSAVGHALTQTTGVPQP
ncbi:hypothetical protein OOK29_32965 [Streptomyces phaeochromogenes]|uniref:hypothetical protein n=1 Tax=Streptomyces phaeochromogenes TaxID=1923 RepID=UPI0022558BAB|nr:hypothetical protein [Streptomyces phaeochromogenes]MCX5602958.1 hypothetical protein [Streptomyces phaeochromogenes]